MKQLIPALAAFVCLTALSGTILAQNSITAAPVMSGDDIAKALKPAPVAHTRGLTRRSDTPAAPPAPTSISLNIPFKYNSSALETSASDQLKQLELALNTDALHSDRFLVAGHTDAKGNARYNKQLSAKRAESVKQFLIAHGVDAGRLDTVGYGSDQLLTPDHPEDATNRRVEIRDLGSARQ